MPSIGLPCRPLRPVRFSYLHLQEKLGPLSQAFFTFFLAKRHCYGQSGKRLCDYNMTKGAYFGPQSPYIEQASTLSTKQRAGAPKQPVLCGVRTDGQPSLTGLRIYVYIYMHI